MKKEASINYTEIREDQADKGAEPRIKENIQEIR